MSEDNEARDANEAADSQARASSARFETITNRIVSGSATFIAIIALATGMYQSKLMRDQAKASVWPYILVGNSGNGGYGRIVQNVGLGPAIVRSFEVTVNGKRVRSWKEAADSMNVHLDWKRSVSTTFGPGLVVPMNTTIELLLLPDSADERRFRSGLDKLQTMVCYCSLYGDCWKAGGVSYEPQPVRQCVSDANVGEGFQ